MLSRLATCAGLGESPLVTSNVGAEDGALEGWFGRMADDLLDTLGNLDDAVFVMSTSTEELVPGVAGGPPTPELEGCLSPCGMGTCTREHYHYSSRL